MNKNKQIAIRLRLQGKSYLEIQREIGQISKSTLSLWLRGIVLSDRKKEALSRRTNQKSLASLLAHNKSQTLLAAKRIAHIQNSAKSEIGHLSISDMLIVGTALYWAEGYKRQIVRRGKKVFYYPVSLTNADPWLLKIFLRFLREVCGVSTKKIKVEVRIFKHLNEENILRYWSNILEIPRGNFLKSYIAVSKSSSGKKPFNRLPYGVAQIRISNTDLFYKIMGWISGIKENAECRGSSVVERSPGSSGPSAVMRIE